MYSFLLSNIRRIIFIVFSFFAINPTFAEVKEIITYAEPNSPYELSASDILSISTNMLNNDNNEDAITRDQILLKRAIKAKQMKVVGIIYTAYIVLSPIGIPLWIVGHKKCKQLEREGFDFTRLKIRKKKSDGNNAGYDAIIQQPQYPTVPTYVPTTESGKE